MNERDIKFNEWKLNPEFPNIKNESSKQRARGFFDIISNNELEKPLYKHQKEAILQVIYAYEIEKDMDVLMDIVTGGGKTVIMAAIVAYFWQVHEINKFLILTPNTIVRERVKDDFDVKGADYAYNNFAFFFNSHKNIPKKLVSKVLREKSDSRSIIDANVIVANIHQLYEGRESLEVMLSDNILSEMVVFNDEAHNAGASQYREVLKLLNRKTRMRIDLTATPFRLDGDDLDTYPPIYTYQVQEATKDRVVKQTLITKPDIEKVKLTYEEWDDENKVVRTLDAEEMDWNEIEKTLKNSGAVKFVTAKNARRQQLQIAETCLDYQRKCIPLDHLGKRAYEPIMLVVSLSQKDAKEIYKTLLGETFKYKEEEVLLVHSKQEDETQNKMAFLMGRSSPQGLSKEDVEIWERARKIKIVIGIGMLREGWDVRNISVICLFRKFSYIKKGDQVYTVYGPQIIGRGLRKINKGKQIDHLLVVDHPVFSHNWLWEMMGSQMYARPLNPGDKIDEGIIEDLKEDLVTPAEDTTPNTDDVMDTSKTLEEILNAIPEIKDIVPITEWKQYFLDKDFTKGISSALQTIKNIKTTKVGSDNTAHEIPNDLINLPDSINNFSADSTKTREEKMAEILSELEYLPKQVLNYTFKQVTAENLTKISNALNWILSEKFEIKNISSIQNELDQKINKLHLLLPQILEEFNRPEIIMGIVEDEKI
ncbi:MAG: DEAD/DEAH box helicase family protein [Candidatus Pacebacteria bacterium]|nr:DEAD/DEAH box helicase family protein [Candidatus Paceibacterota bacterium]